MKKLFYYGNQYVAQSDWKDLALIKICLFAMGLAVGCAVPEKRKKITILCALSAFWATYAPLMAKLASIVLADKKEGGCPLCDVLDEISGLQKEQN